MKIEEKALKYLPLTEATFYILISLVEPLHGYGIMQKADEISEGKVKIGPGTLYGALNKLLKEGVIQNIEETEAGNERRKSYCLTDLGRTILRLEYQRLSEMVKHGGTVITKIGGRVDEEQ